MEWRSNPSHGGAAEPRHHDDNGILTEPKSLKPVLEASGWKTRPRPGAGIAIEP